MQAFAVAVAVAVAVEVAVEVAGQRPALPWVQGAALPNTPAYILLTND